MTASVSTKNQSAIIAADAETSALSHWEALATDIAIATEESGFKQFDYRDAVGNKQARSWMAQLRKLKGRIERARKDAKAVHLQRGKAVDEAARTLEGAVLGLIEPHEQAIEAIEAEERARVEVHRAMLDRISRLAEGVTTSAEAHARLVELTAIDLTLLEEFQSAGLNRQAEAGARLKELWDSLLIQEAERAELEILRAEKAKREAAEALELKRQLAEIQQATPSETVQPSAPAADASWPGRPTRALVELAALEVDASSGPELCEDRSAQVAELREQLFSVLADMELCEIVALIVGDNLHEAISVDWSKVEVEEFSF
jgi:hypothetical protein